MLSGLSRAAEPQQIIPLWPQGTPGAAGSGTPEKVRLTERGEHIVSNVHAASITAYLPLPERATGAAVIVLFLASVLIFFGIRALPGVH